MVRNTQQALATPYLVRTHSLFDRATIAWFEMESAEGPRLQQELDRRTASTGILKALSGV